MIGELQHIILNYLPIGEIISLDINSDAEISLPSVNIRRRKGEINWREISSIRHPKIIQLCTENISIYHDYIDWDTVIENTQPYMDELYSAYAALFRENMDKINWNIIPKLPHSDAIQLVREYIIKHREYSHNVQEYSLEHQWAIYCNLLHCWRWLSCNRHPDAVQLCRENIEDVEWKYISMNTNPDAIQLIRDEIKRRGNTDFIEWWALSENENSHAIQLCSENIKKCDWCRMRRNKHPDAIRLFRDYNLGRLDYNLGRLDYNLEQ